MSLECRLEIESDKADGGSITVLATLEALPRIGEQFYFDDTAEPPNNRESVLGIHLENTYRVTRVVHNARLGIADDGTLRAYPDKDFGEFSIYLVLEKE